MLTLFNKLPNPRPLAMGTNRPIESKITYLGQGQNERLLSKRGCYTLRLIYQFTCVSGIAYHLVVVVSGGLRGGRSFLSLGVSLFMHRTGIFCNTSTMF